MPNPSHYMTPPRPTPGKSDGNPLVTATAIVRRLAFAVGLAMVGDGLMTALGRSVDTVDVGLFLIGLCLPLGRLG